MSELLDIVQRTPEPEPWSEGEKIPWDDPEFSERMLAEHLTDAHDAASRRASIIDSHVQWIHSKLLGAEPSRVLDLGCGPGLYASRLAALGHETVGIDFSPASIKHAREQAEEKGLNGEYVLRDVREADYPSDMDLVMLIFGELNVFRPSDARTILDKAHAALRPGGTLLLEVHNSRHVETVGKAGVSWTAREQGLFSSRPHLLLTENFWNEVARVAIERYYVIDATTAKVTRYSSSMQSYSGSEYRQLLEASGFQTVRQYAGLSPDHHPDSLFVLVAAR